MSFARISSKGQVTIPANIRKILGIKPGSHISFVIKGDSVSIQRADKGIASLKGSIPVAGPQDFKAARHQVMEEVSQEIAQENARD